MKRSSARLIIALVALAASLALCAYAVPSIAYCRFRFRVVLRGVANALCASRPLSPAWVANGGFPKCPLNGYQAYHEAINRLEGCIRDLDVAGRPRYRFNPSRDKFRLPSPLSHRGTTPVASREVERPYDRAEGAA